MGDLSPHFSRSEFACRCNCGFASVDAALITGLEQLRAMLGVPIRILSGCRCPKHNAAVGGAKNSQHMLGKAADICVDATPDLRVSAEELFRYAQGVPQFGGFGVDNERHFLHVDTRAVTARWRYHNGRETPFV